MVARPAPLESEADRLAYLEAFGAPAYTEAGGFLVVYNEAPVEALFDDQQVNTSDPQISSTHTLFVLNRVKQGARVSVETDEGSKDFIVREVRPGRDGWDEAVLDPPA